MDIFKVSLQVCSATKWCCVRKNYPLRIEVKPLKDSVWFGVAGLSQHQYTVPSTNVGVDFEAIKAKILGWYHVHSIGTSLPHDEAFFDMLRCLARGEPIDQSFWCIACKTVVRGPKHCNLCGASNLKGAKCPECNFQLEKEEAYCGKCGSAVGNYLSGLREILGQQAGRRLE